MSIYRDFGITIRGSVLGNANAALGVNQRKGIGKTRHIDAIFLRVQEKKASKEIKRGEILGKDNPADLFTKFPSGDEIDKHMTAMDFEFKSGHDDIALTINTFDKDVNCDFIELCITHTLAQAQEVQRTAEKLGLGITKTAQGFALRCIPENKVEVNKLLNPDAANAFRDLFSLEPKDKTVLQYWVRGVDEDMTSAQLHKELTRAINWRVKSLIIKQEPINGC